MSTPETIADETVRLNEILTVTGLNVDFRGPNGWVNTVTDVNFGLSCGQTLGLVGESGCGKTVTAQSILRLIGGANARISSGSVMFEGNDLLTMPHRQLRNVRGNKISMIFQEPRRSLNPAFTVGEQVAESIRAHGGVPRREAWERAVEMLDRVRIPNSRERAKEYPFQFSGGMCQRVMLAVALAARPDVLIADEPTTALDVTVQKHILDLMRELQAELGLSILFISHDLAVVANLCDRVVVMYAGQVIEEAPTTSLLENPRHPYTQGLLDATPTLRDQPKIFRSIPGSVPLPTQYPTGCRFGERCTYSRTECERPVELTPVRPNSTVRCTRRDEFHLSGIQR